MASVIVGKTQRYKELNIASVSSWVVATPSEDIDFSVQWAGTTVGFGLMTLIKENSSAGYWAGTLVALMMGARIKLRLV